MPGYIAYGAAQILARIWLTTSAQSWRNLPTPPDRALVHAPGAESARVLLVGSGIAVGYGVVSHDLALGGNLARELAAETGRGASVRIVASSDLGPAGIPAALAALDLARFDAVVLTLGGFETLTLMPARLWRRKLRKLLDELRDTAPPGLEIVIVEASAPLLAGLPAVTRALVASSLGRINDVTRDLCAQYARTSFVAFEPAQGDVSSLQGRSTYRGWAELIAPAVALSLTENAGTRHPDTVDEAERQLAIDSLDFDGPPTDELERIVANTRALLGATGAAVTLLDHDVQLTKAAAGMPRTSIPRELSICDLTIRSAELLVIEDVMTDPRLAGTPWADGTRGRFYAGYPVESPDGQRIGALCVVDAAPRRFSDTDAALLRELALQVQSALWGAKV